ncbi:5-formyltetrahydrofolate cyclo-ligase [uncultured Amaricoccus sp.]|uniref:5-formyltetrahydrofolate cyclo-ligase n=1 Tax=uncultured Amaricoccus sp. TaxID=339341 RepID=UPI0026065DD8|nr:5-formyltetrahydrofolate cyclo-ligase [uncultured Amaricoccus sp.]
MSDSAEAKKVARTAAFEARAQAHAEGVGAARRAAGHVLTVVAALREARVVSGYLPIRTELDPMPAMLALHGLGYRLCVPVIEAPRQPLRFRAWTPDATLVPGPFGVSVPAEGEELEPDILLVPLLAFDSYGNRLGYGGGFYDRTLHALRARRMAWGYGFAYERQLVPEVPRALTDAVLDGVVTETGARLPV